MDLKGALGKEMSHTLSIGLELEINSQQFLN